MIQARALAPSPDLCCLPTPHRISQDVAGMAFNFSKIEISHYPTPRKAPPQAQPEPRSDPVRSPRLALPNLAGFAGNSSAVVETKGRILKRCGPLFCVPRTVAYPRSAIWSVIICVRSGFFSPCSCSLNLSTLLDQFMLQNFGPHMLQNAASL